MKAEQIEKLIAQENAHIESEVSDVARNIIRAIVREQEQISESNKAIERLRGELQKLTAETIDPKNITG